MKRLFQIFVPIYVISFLVLGITTFLLLQNKEVMKVTNEYLLKFLHITTIGTIDLLIFLVIGAFVMAFLIELLIIISILIPDKPDFPHNP